MKRILTAVLAMALGILLVSMNGAAAESTPLFYEVRDDAGHKLYLMGTIHLGAESMYPMDEPVQQAYRESEIIAVEMDVASFMSNPFSMARYGLALNYGLGDSAANHLSKETYDLGMQAIDQPGILLSRMHPQGWIAFAEEQSYARTGQSKDWGVEMVLLKQAHKDRKKVEEVEGLDDQIAMVLSIPDAVADYQLLQLVKYPEQADARFAAMGAAWASGDKETMQQLIREERTVPPELEEAFRPYDERYHTLRDDAMEEKAVRYLESGKTVFMALGNSHVIGDHALVERLAERGYTVIENRR